MKTLERDLRAARDSWSQSSSCPISWAAHAGLDRARRGGGARRRRRDRDRHSVLRSDDGRPGDPRGRACARSSAARTLDSLCEDLARLDASVPLIAMTYYNIVLHYGLERCAGKFRRAASAAPSFRTSRSKRPARGARPVTTNDVATVLLVAPSTPPERVDRLSARTEGFAYASARMAVTGKATGGGDGERVVRSIRRTSDVPALIGIGIATPIRPKRPPR